ncbi:MAG: hypothetical protein ACJASY_000212 [Halioglobus sp.]|jgi:hypothetical protein
MMLTPGAAAALCALVPLVKLEMRYSPGGGASKSSGGSCSRNSTADRPVFLHWGNQLFQGPCDEPRHNAGQ